MKDLFYKLFLSPFLGGYLRHLVFSAPGGAAIFEGISLLWAAETRFQGLLTLLSGIGLLSSGIKTSLTEKKIAAKKVEVLENTVIAVDKGDAQATDV